MDVHGTSKCSENRDSSIVSFLLLPWIRCGLQHPQDSWKSHFWFIDHSHWEEEAKPSQLLPKSQVGGFRAEQIRRQTEIYLQKSQTFPSLYTAVLLSPRDKFTARHWCPDSAIHFFKTEAKDSGRYSWNFSAARSKGYNVVIVGAWGPNRKSQKFLNTSRERSNSTDIWFGSTSALQSFGPQKQLLSSFKSALTLVISSPTTLKLTSHLTGFKTSTIPNANLRLLKYF